MGINFYSAFLPRYLDLLDPHVTGNWPQGNLTSFTRGRESVCQEGDILEQHLWLIDIYDYIIDLDCKFCWVCREFLVTALSCADAA